VPGVSQFLRRQLAPLTRRGPVLVVSDAMLVLPAAGLDVGIAVVCGTGSVAIASCDNRTVQVGGWGYLLGDEGGGYWIVREAVRVLLHRRDTGTAPGDLGSQLLAATGSHDLAMLHRRYYQHPHLPGIWARYAEVVLGTKDPAAADICARAAAAAGALAATASREFGKALRLPVVLAGGLCKNPVFCRAACAAVANALPGAEVNVLAGEPVAGAVRLAGLAAARSGH
jgi:glucosamine kinase